MGCHNVGGARSSCQALAVFKVCKHSAVTICPLAYLFKYTIQAFYWLQASLQGRLALIAAHNIFQKGCGLILTLQVGAKLLYVFSSYAVPLQRFGQWTLLQDCRQAQQ